MSNSTFSSFVASLEASQNGATQNGQEQQLNNSDTQNQNVQDVAQQTDAAPLNGQQTDAQVQPQQDTPPSQEQFDTINFTLSLDGETQQTPETKSEQQQNGSVSFDWKEYLKKNRDEALKELGISPFAIELDNYMKAGGKPIDYLMARAIDYNSMSDEQIVKESLKEEYPNLTPEQIDVIFNRKYKPNEFSSDEDILFMEASLKADAYKARQKKIEQQQKFQIPEPERTVDEDYENYKKTLAEYEAKKNELINFYNTHPATKSLMQSKRVTLNIEDGVPPFNITVDNPELIVRALTDGGETMQKLMVTKTGEPDVAKEQLLALIAFDPYKFIRAIFNYGAQQGVLKKLVKENQNAGRPAIPTSARPEEKIVVKEKTFGQLVGT